MVSSSQQKNMGGNGGYERAEITLQFPEEYLVSVSGHYSPVVYGGSPVLRLLTFNSNKRTFGPYGAEEGTPFTFPMDRGLIVVFRGRSG
ncbi:Jacalin-like lectin domain containing protein [Parasponia andersonii]|uniref:Jacalin-like lectin domain containing protein n=1 Tax=Parasponia andersonii TaxID=3476 RepID=A0A2P5BPK6_PARAD|nr:Jacalin-like lectin domain containing protein [Parasponia andersonii]